MLWGYVAILVWYYDAMMVGTMLLCCCVGTALCDYVVTLLCCCCVFNVLLFLWRLALYGMGVAGWYVNMPMRCDVVLVL